MRRAFRRAAFYAGLLALWQALSAGGPWPPYLLPGPLEVGRSLVSMAADGTLAESCLVSFTRLFLGYGLAASGGVLLGLLLSRVGWLEDTLGSLVLGFQTLPSICWLPLALIWFGLSEAAILFVVVMGAVLSVAIATDGGVKHVPPVLVRAARSMGAKGPVLVRRVILPAAFPSILMGLKQGWSFAWRSLMAAELLYLTRGLGFLLHTGRELNDTARVLAVILILVVLGALVDRLAFAPLERHVRRRWGLDAT